ncbi:PAS domain S-box protein [Floridanema evergladense]|uniref:histidine kinase n=1 Tax=Floridaenema evergladense BLCC-F167 TaxID=3153639 RepID=A0ABV4WVD1_9CYAN
MNLQKIRSLSKKSSLLTTLIGGIALIGWIFHIELLKSGFPGLPPMRVNAALGFILSGISLWFWQENSYQNFNRSHQRSSSISISYILAIVVACVALLTLIQFFFNINLGIDELLIKDFTLRISYIHPGRMAATLALMLLILSSALILLNKGIYSLAQGFAFGSFLTSLLGLIGYIYHVPNFYNLFSGGSTALNSIVASGSLSLGILFAHPEQGWLKVFTSPYAGGITARRFLPFVIGLPLLIGTSLILSYRYNFMPIEVSIVLRSAINILILTVVTWWNAKFLNELDLKQKQIEIALQQSLQELENRVADRTAELININHDLQESYQLWQSIIEGISDSIYLKDRSGRYLMVNEAMRRKLGKSNAEILGFNDYELFTPEVARQLSETDNRIMELGESRELEEEIVKNNQQKTYLSTKSPWRDREGNVIGLIGVIKDITERKRAEELLRENERRLQLALQATKSGIWDWDLVSNVVKVSEEYCHLLGFDPTLQTVTYEKWLNSIHPDDRASVTQALRQAMEQNQDYEIVYRVLHPDEGIRWIASRGQSFTDAAGNVVRMLGNIQDITEKQAVLHECLQAELALQTSEEQLRLTLEFAQIGSWDWQIQDNRITWNSNHFHLFGLDPETTDVDYQTWRDRVHPEDIERVETDINQAIESHRDYHSEYRVIYPDGSVHWVFAKGRAIYDRSGQPLRMLGVVFDITDRKQAELALQASKEQLRLTLEFAQIGSWAWDMVENRLHWNNKLFQLLGLDPNTAEANYHIWRDRIYPDDLERVEAAINRAVEREIDYDAEHRVIHPDGTVLWIIARGRAIYDRSGRPLRMLGVAIDITDRKQIEISLQQSQEHFQRAIVDSPLPIILHAEDGAVLQINHAWTEISGYSPEEIPTIADWTEKAYGSRKELVQEDIKRLHHLDRRVYDGEFTICTGSGETRIWDFYSAPLGKLPDGRNLVISTAIDITDRKRAEADLQQYKDIFQFSEHGLAVGKGTLIEIVNPAFARMHGYSVEEMIGKSILSLFPQEFWGDTIAFMQELNEVGHITHESYHLRKDGTIFPVFLDITMVKDRQNNPLYRIVTLLDISDRKKAQAALQKSEERLRLALQAANQGMWDLNVQTGEAIVSAEYARMLGYESEEIQETNAKWRERLHPEERESVYQVYADYIAGKCNDYRVECRQLTKTGEWKWVLSSGKIVEWDRFGQPLRMLGTHTDISDRKQAELAVIQLNQTLEQRVKERTAELTAANKELEAFSYSVSHDLRAPLRGIDGFSKVLLERYGDRLDEKGKHYLERIRAGSQRMGELIENLLMLSRVTRAEMKRIPVNLSEIVKGIIKELSESQPEHSVQWNIAPEITALGDTALLRIMLENLLSNAWKFTANCPQPQIEFGYTILSENRQAYFIKDNGVGFDMTYVNKLFIAFQRLHSNNDFPGTGVGLAIVQRIIHRHGGQVWAEGIINGGATFYFTLG